jgi:hypothetical protein
VTETIAGKVGWSSSLIVIDGMMAFEDALALIKSAPPWVVIRRGNGNHLYAFRSDELWAAPLFQAARNNPADRRTPIANVLALLEEHQSTKISDRTTVPAIDRSWRPHAKAESIDRYIEVGPDNAPRAVGTMVLAGGGTRGRVVRGMRPSPPPAPPPPPPPAPMPQPPEAVDFGVPAPSGQSEPAPPAPAPSDWTHAEPPETVVSAPLEDEGTAPLRHPSIDIDQPLAPERDVVVVIDLLHEAVTHTQGGPVIVGQLAADWQTLDLTVHLQCAALEFANGSQAIVTINRNAASVPAKLKARVRADAAAGSVAVMATFMMGTRFCGSAVRLFDVGTAQTGARPGGVRASPELRPRPTSTLAPGDVAAAVMGTVVVERAAEQPDLTVHISRIDKDKPALLRWLMVTKRFDGLPPRLEGEIQLDHDPATQASALFKEFAVLERGKHTERIEGFGSRLWTMAPDVFRKVYWALWDRHQRPLTIQFISEEPHMPWELMRPVREDESEIHPPLALKHAVARWIKRWDGYMRNRLPAGRLCTIAPKYASVSRALKRAQIESDTLVTAFSARREDGTRTAVLTLLQAEPSEPVAILHFAGHGKFAPEAATHSNIKLEDGDLTASEVERPEVRLGRCCRTLVFFNACEVGAAGAVFGEVGGWADAFLGRQFGGFIAPLWSVDDEDAGVVAVELLERILKQGKPIGAALRDVREAHGATSPTFYSYLYYGDVTARIAI